MPLYARHVDEHCPDRNPSEHADDFVVLSGSLEAGSFHRIANGPSEGRWSWGAGLGAATANFVATGYATSPDECRTHVARSFRLDACARRPARATGREAGTAAPRAAGSDSRNVRTVAAVRSRVRSHDPQRASDRRQVRRARRWIALALDARTRVLDWILTGVPRPDDEDFAWHRLVATETEAFDEIAASWSRWTYWAGFEPIAPLQRGMKRG
jgi:hypothetical protein